MSLPTVVPPALRLLHLNWSQQLKRDSAGVPRLPPEVVAEQGQMVRILDVRDREELQGPLGHIPAVTHVPLANVGTVPAVLDGDTCVVLVSNEGDRAAIAARYLEALGMKHVAALAGGMRAWKQLGFVTRRDESFRTTLRALAPGVARDGRPLRDAGATLTLEDLEDHMGDPGSVRWVKLAALLLHGKRSCVDGRDDHGVIGTPGGDAGELLLGLAAAEQITGRALSDEEVGATLLSHLDVFGRFYLHSDTHAMNHLIVDGFRQDPRIADAVRHLDAPDEWRAFAADPPLDLRPAMLEHLVRPENMGCGHLRFAMKDEATYGVRAELSRSLLRAFHTLRWQGAPELEWVVLGGEHHESAVLQVVLDEGLRAFSRVPLVSPLCGLSQLFVNHPQVTSYLRAELAHFLVEERLLGLASDDGPKLTAAMSALGDRQAGATLGQLAMGLPLFEVRFSADRTWTASQAGVVEKPAE